MMVVLLPCSLECSVSNINVLIFTAHMNTDKGLCVHSCGEGRTAQNISGIMQCVECRGDCLKSEWTIIKCSIREE